MTRIPALLVGIALLSLPAGFLSPSAQGAPPRTHPFPPAVDRPNPMKAPGLLSGPKVPLAPVPLPPVGSGVIDTQPHTGYESFLRRPVEGGERPLFLGLLAFYRTVISPLNGSNSDLAPVHSLYAVQAIKEYGVLLGSVLTTERLFHEPDESPFAPPFREDGRVFHYDPLWWNVYWLPDSIR